MTYCNSLILTITHEYKDVWLTCLNLLNRTIDRTIKLTRLLSSNIDKTMEYRY